MIKKICAMLAIGSVVFPFAAEAQVNQQIMDASADQSQGNYTPMNMDYAGFGSLGMTQAAWLDPLQNLGEGQSRPAYSKYYWSPDLVLPVRVREGMLTMINFPEWELIEDIYLGDSNTFDGQISGPNTLLLYPKNGAQVGVDTNIIVFGRSGNRYVFYLKSEAVNTERLTNAIIDIDVVDGNGVGDSLGSNPYGGKGGALGNGGGSKAGGNISTYTRRFQKSDWLQSIPVDPSDFKFDLEVYVPNPDDVVIAPERVWRDNIFTYIDLGKKALNMVQRPVVSMIVERVEVPVGFRSKGPDNRLIVVEGIGDMVLRNGKRIICIKMRRSDENGLEYAVDSADYLPPSWEVGPAIPNAQTNGIDNNINYNVQGQSPSGVGNGMPSNSAAYPQGGYPMGNAGGMLPVGQMDIQAGQGQIIIPEYAKVGGNNGAYGQVADNFDYSKMQKMNIPSNIGSSPIAPQYAYGAGFMDADNSNISIELGTDGDVANLESLWGKLSNKYKELDGFNPFFSVDAPADGQGRELFHLRVGPIKSLEAGDKICSSLGRNGVFCSVVRTQ